LIIENTNLISEDFDALIENLQITCNCFGTALLPPVDLVNSGGQGDGAGHHENDRKSQSYVPAAHVIVSRNLVSLLIRAKRSARLSLNEDEWATRKRLLFKGPKEFRNIRGDLPKAKS
jgi:hypothetical protein